MNIQYIVGVGGTGLGLGLAVVADGMKWTAIVYM